MEKNLCTQIHLRQSCQLLPLSLAWLDDDLGFGGILTSPRRIKTCSVTKGRKPVTGHLCPVASWGLRARAPGWGCKRRNLLQQRTLYFLWPWVCCCFGVRFQGAPAQQFCSSNLQGLPVSQAAFIEQASKRVGAGAGFACSVYKASRGSWASRRSYRIFALRC